MLWFSKFVAFGKTESYHISLQKKCIFDNIIFNLTAITRITQVKQKNYPKEKSLKNKHIYTQGYNQSFK